MTLRIVVDGIVNKQNKMVHIADAEMNFNGPHVFIFSAFVTFMYEYERQFEVINALRV